MENNDGLRLFNDINQYQNCIYVKLSNLKKVVPQHTHVQGHILVVLEGAATINVERSVYYIPNGYFVWIPSKVLHRVSFEGSTVKVLNIYYPAQFSETPFYSAVGIYPIPSILYHTLELVSGQTQAYTVKDWVYELLVTLHHIIPHIIPEQKYPLRLPTSDYPVIQKIVDLIQTNYQEPITAESVSQSVGISVRTLSRYLHNELNMSLVQYVRTFRIIMAIKMMVTGEDSITNIAYLTGFESLTTFSNSFYQVTGKRPSQFLK